MKKRYIDTHLYLNSIQAKFIDELIRTGLWGSSKAEVIMRIVDRFFIESVAKARALAGGK